MCQRSTVVFIFVVLFFSKVSQASECGIFKVVKGNVTYKKNSGDIFRKARINKKVCSGYVVKTQKDSRAKVQMPDGNEINISTDSKIIIEQYRRDSQKDQKKVFLNILYGKIRSNVQDKYKGNENSYYKVKTKSAIAGVRGTEFLTSFNKKTQKSRVVTFKGEVSVSEILNGKIGSEVLLKSGQYTSNSLGSKLQKPQSLPPQELKQLNQETSIQGSSPRQNSSVESPEPAHSSGQEDGAGAGVRDSPDEVVSAGDSSSMMGESLVGDLADSLSKDLDQTSKASLKEDLGKDISLPQLEFTDNESLNLNPSDFLEIPSMTDITNITNINNVLNNGAPCNHCNTVIQNIGNSTNRLTLTPQFPPSATP